MIACLWQDSVAGEIPRAGESMPALVPQTDTGSALAVLAGGVGCGAGARGLAAVSPEPPPSSEGHQMVAEASASAPPAQAAWASEGVRPRTVGKKEDAGGGVPPSRRMHVDRRCVVAAALCASKAERVARDTFVDQPRRGGRSRRLVVVASGPNKFRRMSKECGASERRIGS